MNIKSLLVLGAQGMLGREVVGALKQKGWRQAFGSAAVHACDIQEVDITDPKSVSRCFEMFLPDLVINCAAYTDVDGCESRRTEALAVNGAGPRHIAQSCRDHNSRLIHISTDFVFDGRSQEPYQPDDPTGPISAYGESKLAGETAVQETLEDYLIVRTSWLFGRYGKSFVTTICRLAGERDYLEVVTDQVGSPTYAVDLAEGLLHLAQTNGCGMFHFCNQGHCSWYDFAVEIVKVFDLDCRIKPTTSEQFTRPAARPAWSVLDISKYLQITGQPVRTWRQALEHYRNHS